MRGSLSSSVRAEAQRFRGGFLLAASPAARINRREHPWELIGCSCCCRGNERGSERVCRLRRSLLKQQGARVPGMA